MYRQHPQALRLPPTKYRSLEINSTSPKSANGESKQQEEVEEMSINSKARAVNDKITRTMYGPSRRAIMKIDDSIKRERALQSLREGGFTLDCISVASGDKGLKLPPYNPFYDPSQHLFLKSPERRSAALQAYDWKTMIRDQSQMMKHNASLLSRRVGNGSRSTIPPNILNRSQFGMASVGLTSLDNSVSVEGSFAPGVRVGQSDPSTPEFLEMDSIEYTEARKTAHINVNELERSVTSREGEIVEKDNTPTDESVVSDPGIGTTKLLRPKFVSDPSFSPAFRRTVLMSLRRSGAKVDSPYHSMSLDSNQVTMRATSRGEDEAEANESFTKLEIRKVIRYTEDCCDSTTQSNGLIDFPELEAVFRRARRARAAAKFEIPGRKAMLKLERLLRSREQDVKTWFEEVDCVHRDGVLTHEELSTALMRLRDPKQEAFNPYSLLAIGRESEKEEASIAWMNYNRIAKQAPQELDKFYDTEEAYARYMKLAEAAAEKAEKAEKRKQAAAKRREEANTEFASNELFAVPTELDPTAKSQAKEEMMAAEKELEDAEVEVAETRKAAVTAAAVAMKAARDLEEEANEEENNAGPSTNTNIDATTDTTETAVASITSPPITSDVDMFSVGSEDDDSSLAGKKSYQEAERARYKADQAAKDAKQMDDIKEKCTENPEAHTEEVQLAYETFTEPEKMKNYKKYGHPHGILKNTVHPFTAIEVENLIKYTDPDMDGRLSLQEVEVGLERAHRDPDDVHADQSVGQILKKLEGKFQKQGAYGRIRELFDHLDTDGSGEISFSELRKGLLNWNKKSAHERFQEKREKDMKYKAELNEINRERNEAQLRERLEKAEASGAMEALLKLDEMLKSKCMRTQDLFREMDVDRDGDLDIDEFMEGLAKDGAMNLSKQETRQLVDFFDGNGDGSIDPEEFDAVIKRLRKDRRKFKALKKK